MKLLLISKKKLLIILSCVLAVVLSVSIFSGTEAYSVFYGGTLRKLPIYSVGTDEKKVAISFDCAWGTDYTDKLLSVMEEKGVKCTFFSVKFWTDKHPDYVKKIVEHGHEMGTHSSTHPQMSRLDKNAIVKELNDSRKAIEDITGVKVELFRAPFGDYNDLLIDTATELGLYTIQWDVDSLDWKDLSAKDITERVVSRVQNGSIVLFHNQGLHTHEALPTIIDTLKARGYELVPISKLILRENYKILHTGQQVKL